jgi:DNA-binding MarR family transcriptional regulator
VVASNPGLSVNELAERLRISQQSASRHASFLMGRYTQSPGATFDFARTPLLSQSINPDDPRKRALHLTENGAALIAKVFAALNC